MRYVGCMCVYIPRNIYMYLCVVLPGCMSVPPMFGARGGQKSVSDPLELKLQAIVSLVGPEN